MGRSFWLTPWRSAVLQLWPGGQSSQAPTNPEKTDLLLFDRDFNRELAASGLAQSREVLDNQLRLARAWNKGGKEGLRQELKKLHLEHCI